MSKRLTLNTHWLPKTGSFAVRLNRRGDIGSTAPSRASDATYAELNERAERAQTEMREIDRQLPLLRGDDARAKTLKRKFQLEAELKNLRFERHMAYLPSYAEAFLAAARMLLSADAVQQIDNTVIEKLGLPPRHWQRFLADNGFGKMDTSTYHRTKSSRT